MKVLIVEDNKILSNNISAYLQLENIQTHQLFEGSKVNYELTINNYDLIILDLGLPDIDGVELCKKIRNSGKNIPILMLTARNTINDKISGLKSGADDYLTKPFDYEELIVRIEVLLRRNFSVKSENIQLEIDGKTLEINKQLKQVSFENKNIHLSNTEYELLLYLVQNKGNIISKETLLEKVWGDYDDFNLSRTVDVYVGYLRKKITKSLVCTIRGEGYIIK